MRDHTHPIYSVFQFYQGYGVAVGAVAIAFVLKSWLTWIVQLDSPFLLFFAAIAVSTWYGGKGPGIFTTLLAATISYYFFLTPIYSFAATDGGQTLRLLVFILEGLFLTGILSRLKSIRTLLKTQQTELQTTRQQHHLLVNSLQDLAICLLDTQGQILNWNQGAERLQGYRADELIGQNFSRLYPLEAIEQGQPEQLLAQAKVQGRVIEEGWRLCKDGSRLWARVTLTALRDEGGQLQGFSQVMQDKTSLKQTEGDLENRVQERTAQLLAANRQLEQEIAERQKIEQALRESDRRFQAIFNQTFQFIGLMQPDGILLEANETALQFGGLQPEDVIGRPVWEAKWWSLSPQTQQRLQQAIQQAAAGEFIRYEVEVLGADDRIATIDFSIKPIYNEAQEVVLLIPEGRDISERKQVEQTLRSFFNSASMMMGMVELIGDQDILHLADNPATARFFGFTCEDLRGRTAGELGTPADHIQLWMKHYRAAERSQTPVRFEYTHQTADGERWLSATVFSIPDLGTQSDRCGYIVEDITERKQVESQLQQLNTQLEQRVQKRTAQLEAVNQSLQQEIRDRTLAQQELAKSEQKFRLVAESMPQIVWTAQPNGEVDYYNQRWAEFSGMSTQAGQGWGWQPVLHPDDAQPTLEAWTKAVQSREIYACEHRIRRADGEFRWHLSRGFPLRDDQGQIIKWFGTATDIHDQKLIQETLRQSEQRLQMAIDHIPDVFVIYDAQRRFEYVNAEGLRRTQQPLAYFLGRRDEDVHPPEVTDGYLPTLLRTVETLTLQTAECTTTSTTFGTFTMIVTYVPLLNDQGKLIQILGITHDITERKRYEAELAQANRLKDEFLATISHELRTPLNSLLGWSKLLPSRQFDPITTNRAIETIARNSQTLAHLVEDVLDMSDIIRGQITLAVEAVDLALVIEQAIGLIQLAAQAKGLQIQSDLDLTVDWIRGDADRLQQIVWNLLSNSVKFTASGGIILISLKQVNNQAQIQVIDNGQGIHPEFLPFVFDRFRQENGSITRTHGGLGLGLAITRYLVEIHGGTIQAESQGPGQGATFTVLLPISELKLF